MTEPIPALGPYRPTRLLRRGPRDATWLATSRRSVDGVGVGVASTQRVVLRVVDDPKLIDAADRPSDILRSDFAAVLCVDDPAYAAPTNVFRDEASGAIVLVRSWVDGSDLGAATRGMDADRIGRLLLSAAQSLAALHASGVAHRRVVAENFIVRSDRARDATGSVPVVLGDAAWWRRSAADEVGDHGRSVDVRDFGTLAWSLFTGEPPSSRSAEWLADLRSDLRPDLARFLATIVGDRPLYSDAVELAQDFAKAVDPRATRRSWAECIVESPADLDRASSALVGCDRPRFVLIRGAAESGKSTWLRRIAAAVQLEGTRVVSSSCLPAGATRPEPERLVRELPVSSRRLNELRAETLETSPTVWDPPNARLRYTSGLATLTEQAARNEPLVWLVDDAHFADDWSIELLVELARRLLSPPDSPRVRPDEPRGSFGLVVVVSDEAPCAKRVRALTDLVARATGRPEVIELGDRGRPGRNRGVSPPASFRSASGGDIEPERRRRQRDRGECVGDPRESLYREFTEELGVEHRAALEALALLGRPASVELAASLLDRSVGEASSQLEELVALGAILGDVRGFRIHHTSFLDWVIESIRPERRRDLHASIAAALDSSGASYGEIAIHYLASSRPHRGIRPGLIAARSSTRDHDFERSLGLYRSILDALPSRRVLLAQSIRDEFANCCCLAGRHVEAVEALDTLLANEQGIARRARWLCRLGVSLHRNGDVHRAKKMLVEARECSVRLRDAPGARLGSPVDSGRGSDTIEPLDLLPRPGYGSKRSLRRSHAIAVDPSKPRASVPVRCRVSNPSLRPSARTG